MLPNFFQWVEIITVPDTAPLQPPFLFFMNYRVRRLPGYQFFRPPVLLPFTMMNDLSPLPKLRRRNDDDDDDDDIHRS